MIAERSELQRQVAVGRWLSPGEVAVLLDLSRTTIHGLLESGRISYSLTPGGEKRRHRRCNPDDVRRLLDGQWPRTSSDPRSTIQHAVFTI
jgi:excisionase family DNA binding protein